MSDLKYLKGKWENNLLEKPDIEWLIERVEKLENAVKGGAIITNQSSDIIRQLESENERLRGALESILATDEYEDIAEYIERIIDKCNQVMRGDNNV